MAKWFRPFSLLAAKTYKRPEAKVGPHRSLRSSTKYLTRNPKYPRIHPRFYSPFWRNKPRHALSLQTRSVGAQKGVFAFFPSVRRKSMKKNVKSSIFHKKTSKFFSSLPFKTQTIDNQWEYDDALANSQLIDYQILTIVNNLKYWLKTT